MTLRAACDTADADCGISVIAAQKPQTRQEMEAFFRRDLASMKPPESRNAVWKPDYERKRTFSGIEIYDLTLEGNEGIVLCPVGNTPTQIVDGPQRDVWRGSHVRDTWSRTSDGWRRRTREADNQ